jgi:hypothetical protein
MRYQFTTVVFLLILANYVLVLIIYVLQSLLIRNYQYIESLRLEDHKLFILEKANSSRFYVFLQFYLLSPLMFVNYFYYLAIVKIPVA